MGYLFKDSLFIISAAPLTLAQCGTAESGSVALTVPFTGNHTATVEEQGASLADIFQNCPIWDRHFGSAIPFPPPFTGVWNVWSFGEGLLPDKSCSVQGTLPMLE